MSDGPSCEVNVDREGSETKVTTTCSWSREQVEDFAEQAAERGVEESTYECTESDSGIKCKPKRR